MVMLKPPSETVKTMRDPGKILIDVNILRYFGCCHPVEDVQ